MSITIHRDMVQGSDEWIAARCGLLTASEMRLIVTTSLKPAANDKERAHLFELLAQRVTRYVEPAYISDDMLRGRDDESEARALYGMHYARVTVCGFVTRDFGGVVIGYSPDGLVGDDGLIEIKSRRQKFQAETIARAEMPAEYAVQVQTGLLVTGRAWCDFVSYCGGMPMAVLRVHADTKAQEAILSAAEAFEERLAHQMTFYRAVLSERKFVATERRIEQEMFA